jgi:hypothetical protein
MLTRLQELEKLAAKLLATARKLPPGPNRHNALQLIGRFRVQLICNAPIYQYIGAEGEGDMQLTLRLFAKRSREPTCGLCPTADLADPRNNLA